MTVIIYSLSRHGAHNWEGPGLLTALTSLETLGQITSSADWLINKADAQHVIFAGKYGLFSYIIFCLTIIAHFHCRTLGIGSAQCQ